MARSINSILLLLTVTSASILGHAYSQTPVPARPLGFTVLSSDSPKVVVEFFYDHLCIDSKNNWPILKEVLAGFTGKDVSAIMHIFSLPFHHDTFFAQRAGVLVRRQDPMQFVEYTELMFANQDDFLSGAVDMTEPQVQNAMATLVSSKLSISKDVVMSAFNDTTIDQESRYAWKYACSRGLTGTPQFIVNGVHVPDAPDYTKTQWEDFIDKLLASQFNKSEL